MGAETRGCCNHFKQDEATQAAWKRQGKGQRGCRSTYNLLYKYSFANVLHLERTTISDT